MRSRLILYLSRLHERLWVKPLLYCLLAIASVFVAFLLDLNFPELPLPQIDPDTIERLLSVLSSTMLAVATFAVGSMVSAYASASDNATPRAFTLVLADDLSQTALSSFIGAFIFSVVGIIAVKTGLYGDTGHFALFVLTILLFIWVILTFVRWVDNIARLGRMSSTIDRAEQAAHRCLKQRIRLPYLGGRDARDAPAGDGLAIHADRIGYVQHIEMEKLQEIAETTGAQILVEAMPGTFATHDKPLARLIGPRDLADGIRKAAVGAFLIGSDRTFESDPRFGLIVLSEIAQRALSPAVNDPGTGIVIVGRLVRLLAFWIAPEDCEPEDEDKFDRVYVPALELSDLFDDAFTGIARDGAANIEFGIRLQKGLAALAALEDAEAKKQARRHSALALARAELKVGLEADLDRLRDAAHKVTKRAEGGAA